MVLPHKREDTSFTSQYPCKKLGVGAQACETIPEEWKQGDPGALWSAILASPVSYMTQRGLYQRASCLAQCPRLTSGLYTRVHPRHQHLCTPIYPHLPRHTFKIGASIQSKTFVNSIHADGYCHETVRPLSGTRSHSSSTSTWVSGLRNVRAPILSRHVILAFVDTPGKDHQELSGSVEKGLPLSPTPLHWK